MASVPITGNAKPPRKPRGLILSIPLPRIHPRCHSLISPSRCLWVRSVRLQKDMLLKGCAALVWLKSGGGFYCTGGIAAPGLQHCGDLGDKCSESGADTRHRAMWPSERSFTRV